MVFGGLEVADEFLGGGSDFCDSGVFILGRAVAEGAADDGCQALLREAEDAVVFGGGEAFDGAGIDTERGGAGHELADGDVGLAFCPVGDLWGELFGEEAAGHHAAVALEGVEGDVSGFCGELEEFIDFLCGERGSGGEDDVVRGIDYLVLFPGMGEELFTEVGITDDEEAIGLEAEG
ncbi:MAG: hypothetical protein RI897_2370 [Verrucomicrobiota bacterium]